MSQSVYHIWQNVKLTINLSESVFFGHIGSASRDAQKSSSHPLTPNPFQISDKMPKMKKSKRFNGKDANVAQNVFFESYMKSVAKGKK